MSLLKKFLSPKKSTESAPKADVFIKSFHRLEGTSSFPYVQALEALDNLEQTAHNEQELLFFLLEDIIFTSLYATYYEQILIGLSQNPHVALELIERFGREEEEREKLIGQQTYHHAQFIEKLGLCDGCICCENHTDVAELISPWQKGDREFFINLYVGMQTIQFAMEDLIYEVIPAHPAIITEINNSAILDFRKYLYNFSSLQQGH